MLLACFITMSTFADINEIVARYPAENHAALDAANKALAADIANNVPALCAMITATGDHSDLAARYALSSLTFYLSKDGAPDAYVHALGRALTLSTQPAEVRAVFVRELSMCGSDTAVGYLAPLIGDADLGVPAIEALQSIGSTNAAQAILEGMSGLSGRHLSTAVVALGAMEYAPAAFAIANQLGSEDAAMREAAMSALAKTGAEIAYGPLAARALNPESPNQKVALEHLTTYADTIAAQGRTLNASKIYYLVATHADADLARYARDKLN